MIIEMRCDCLPPVGGWQQQAVPNGDFSMKRLTTATIILGLLLAVGSAHAQNADTRDAGAAASGKIIAEGICSECHAVGKAQRSSPNGLAPAFGAIATTPGMTALALTVALRTSHRSMPNIILSGEESRDVVAYIMSLQ
jgi:mono/diheme cytochrome c family protein